MRIRIFATLAFLLGLLLWRASPQLLAGSLAASLLLLLWHPRLRQPRLALGLTVALLLGLGRAALDDLEASPPVCLKEGAMLSISGTVLESPRQWGGSLVFFLEVEKLQGQATVKPLLLLVRWSGGEDAVCPGERWEMTGRYSRGEPVAYPGGFSQTFWLWTQRAQGTVKVSRFCPVSYLGPPRGWGPRALAARLRQTMLKRLDGVRHQQARALVSGVVFGDTQALPREVQDQFRRTGTSHLLAASGMNVALLIGLLTAAARLAGYGAWRVAPCMIPVAIGYAFLAGCAPSITRAAAAACMGLLAAWLGRRSGPWNSLCLSVLLLLLWEPRQIYDLGFQLSVAAVVGLIAGPSLDEAAASWKKSAVMTVSACMLTLPFMWCAFHELSLTLLPANLILGPLVELLFPLGLLLAVLPLAPLCWLVEGIARLSLFLVAWLSNLADPVTLATPGLDSLAALAVSIGIWVGLWNGARWWALPLAALAMVWGQIQGERPLAAAGELVVRRIDSAGKPFYWLSSGKEELLVLSEPWQEGRARSMMRDWGCLRPAHAKVLEADQTFDVRWGAFTWGNVHPLLPKAPYLEVRTAGCTYTVDSWRPEL